MNAMETAQSRTPHEARKLPVDPSLLRSSICISDKLYTRIIHFGDPGFEDQMENSFTSTESLCLEQTHKLKQKLRTASTWDFWQFLMEGMTEVTGAQYGFVAKRVLHDDEDSAVEMPPLGEPGSCLMGLAFYYSDHQGKSNLFRDYKYQVYGCPCQWMRHDKVLLIPEGLTNLTPENPNAAGFPVAPEGYLAVPLFHKGKCFAHMGVMWSADGLKVRPQVSWGMLEMFLHALEDQVTERVLEGRGFNNPKEKVEIIPQYSVSSQKHSLKPYARTLSHELRTPMQGVVGMLDVMYAAVVEATELAGEDERQFRDMFESLRENIEVAQDSSRRAVDAADNMVHAYDFDMEVPSTPSPTREIFLDRSEDSYFTTTPAPCEHDLVHRVSKRRRDSGSSDEDPPNKIPHIDHDFLRSSSEPYPLLSRGVNDMPRSNSTPPITRPPQEESLRRLESIYPLNSVFAPQPYGTMTLICDAAGKVQLNSKPVKLRELLHQVVHESLRSGGRPESIQSEDTVDGEWIKVEGTGPNGDLRSVEIEIVVDEGVSDTLIIDEMALIKLLSLVFHNAVKFTSNGTITLHATVGNPPTRFVLFSIADTGEGIPEDFLPKLFKAFSREDDSMTRLRDGLGLGLMVAKNIARKMGGDLWCERTSTEGPRKGTEFQIRLPLTPGDAGSIPGTPAVDPGTPLTTPSISQGNTLAGLGNWSLDGSKDPRRSPSATRSLAPSLLNDEQGLSPLPTTADCNQEPEIKVERTLPIPRTPQKKAKTKGLPFDKNLGKKLPLRILVAEDNKINRKILTNMLGKLGFTETFEAVDGEDAVREMKIDRGNEPINVVLMDLWMPRMDGYEATEKILKMPKYRPEGGRKKVTILPVTADVTREAIERTTSVGMEGFMMKPFNIADLERLLMKYCGERLLHEAR
ncbi:hypothetical protein RUND412_003938 [Rhizina undulata]